jgi:plastocyanin
MTRWLALLIACLALGLVVAGCGDDDDDDGNGAAQTTEQTEAATTTEEETTEAETEAGGGAAEAVEVKMKDIAFDPKDVTVPAGGTVKWTNDEAVPHDVTKTEGPGADFSSGSGNMQEGDTFEQKFDEAGEISYECTVHPGMTGTVKVE